jgi:transposase
VARDPKKGAEENAHLVLIDETGCLLAPLVVRTLAPRGQTPILQHTAKREKVSIIAGVSLSPKRSRFGLYFQTLPNQSIKNGETATFLRDLLGHLRGRVIVIWDNGPNHKGPAIRELLKRYPRLTLERLPPYAPELNPVEYLWSHLKKTKLVNLAAQDARELDDLAMENLDDVRHRPNLLKSFFAATHLPIPTGL